MPGHVDERLWEEAKAAVKPRWDKYDDPWAVVQFIYQRKLAAKARGEHVCKGCAQGLAEKYR